MDPGSYAAPATPDPAASLGRLLAEALLKVLDE